MARSLFLVLPAALVLAVPAVAVAAPVQYRAESATISNGLVESNHAGFTGSGFVNYDNEVGSSVEFTVTSPSAGQATLTFRFANGTTANRPMDVSVNGSPAADELSFPGTGAWTTWTTRTTTVNLNAGTNTIKTVATTANGGPNLDRLDVGRDDGDGEPRRHSRAAAAWPTRMRFARPVGVELVRIGRVRINMVRGH